MGAEASVTTCEAVAHPWGHDVGAGLEKLPIWSKCCGKGNFVFQRLQVRGIIAAHFVGSASNSNPKTAEFLPTTRATRKSMLIPASAMV